MLFDKNLEIYFLFKIIASKRKSNIKMWIIYNGYFHSFCNHNITIQDCNLHWYASNQVKLWEEKEIFEFDEKLLFTIF